MRHHDDKFFTIVADKWQRRMIEMKAAALHKKVDDLIFDAVKSYTAEVGWKIPCNFCGGTERLTYNEPYDYSYGMEGEGTPYTLTVTDVPQLKCPDCEAMSEDIRLGALMEDALDDEVRRRLRYRLPLTATITLDDLMYPKEDKK